MISLSPRRERVHSEKEVEYITNHQPQKYCILIGQKYFLNNMYDCCIYFRDSTAYHETITNADHDPRTDDILKSVVKSLA